MYSTILASERDLYRLTGGKNCWPRKIVDYLFRLIRQILICMLRNFVYQKRWYAESTIDMKHQGSPGRIAMCIFRSTPSSEKFCLHALPFIGDIYRLILLFHSSKFKHLNVPVPYRRPCGHKPDNWIGEAPRNVRFRLASFLLDPNISLVFSQLFSIWPVPRTTLPILLCLLLSYAR